jgi:putative ABC transport system permease protein
VAVPLLSLRPSEPPIREIVGVIQQVKLHPNETQAQPTIYVPLAQNSWWTASLVVRPTVGRAEELTRAVRAAVARVDKDLPVTRVRTMSEVGREATSRWRFRAVLVGTFAVLALVLAMVGVFGVLAYSVQQRTREFGVRIALGASVPDVMRLVLTSAVRMTAIGAAIGLVCAGVLSRSIATLLFGVPPLDPVTFGAAATVLLVTAAVAAAAPALRAARIDPIVTLRNE